jgi:Co/Zn/Cd efflux system component
MDCPSEEQMIRMALGDMPIVRSLRCDIPGRTLEVWHSEGHDPILERLHTLNLDTVLLATVNAEDRIGGDDHARERSVLWTVFAINIGFFGLELFTGFFSHSMGLVADSLDMMADGIVYGLALFAVGGTVMLKKNIARTSGYFQMSLAILGFIEIVRRFTGGEEMPVFQTMVIISALALVGNAVCLVILQRWQSNDAHIRASLICTSNDVIANAGVIVAGLLVHFTGSKYPDLIVGAIVFALVFEGSWRMLRLAR